MREAADAAERLHPAVLHHVVNTLGWASLRPLQLAAVDPVIDGENVILVAPTAGGKTEAAVLPLLSRMLAEGWKGLSVLYVCPLRALLNNLEPRLAGYAGLIGRRAALWHGDVPAGDRARILDDPPDLLLTTPESLEAMLISTRVEPRRLFSGLRSVVVDEIHAFAADDRGWHLLAVLARLSRLAGRPLQRLGLSATVGDPERLLAWLTTGCEAPRRVIAPPTEAGRSAEVTIDWVGSVANAATVISRLHRGEKRLVFLDSRSRSEQLATSLRGHEVTTFLSHGSLGRDERRRAEQAFAEAGDCVIVATSTLELGIDVGDLDQVIQIDAPSTVASFLQRLGRTGRREGLHRNTLFLATNSEGFLRAAGLTRAWVDGYVEPAAPPPDPLHLVAQQAMALVLQEHGIGRHTWTEWLGDPPALPGVAEHAEALVGWMLDSGILVDDGGILGFGPEGEATFGRRHFSELTSAFTAPPVLSVRAGRDEIGQVPPVALAAADQAQPPGVLLLAGRSWHIRHVDWRRGVVHVEPSEMRGKVRFGGAPLPLGFELCQAVKAVLCGDAEPGAALSQRGATKLDELRDEHAWLRHGHTTLLRQDDGTVVWWTFAGLRANLALSAATGASGQVANAVDNFTLKLAGQPNLAAVREALERAEPIHVPAALADGLKFSECLPPTLVSRVLDARFADREKACIVMDHSPEPRGASDN